MAEVSYRKIVAFLRAIAEGRMRMRRLEAGLLVALALLAAVLLAPAAVALQPRFGYSAILYLGICLGLVAAAFARGLWLISRLPRDESLALEIERGRPDLGNNLISSLQLFPRKGRMGAEDPTSPALVNALVVETGRQVEGLKPEEFVSSEGPRRLGRLAGAMFATAVLMGLVWPGIYSHGAYLLANAPDLMPSRITHLFLTAGAERVLPGAPVAFEVRAAGRRPRRVELEVALLAREGDGAVRIPMERIGEGRFRATWKSGPDDVRVTARAGRFRSAPLEVKVVPPPRVTGIEVIYFPPEYTGLKPVRGEGGGHIRAYLGSSVMVRAQVNKPVREALVSLEDGWRIPLKPGRDGVLEGVLLLGGPGAYRVRLKDRFGFANLAPERYRIDIIPDTPPRVVVTDPGKDLTVEADEQVAVRFEADDDFGVRNVFVEARIGKRPPRRIRVWGGESPRKAVKGVHVFDLRALGMRPGAALTYRLLADDTDTVGGPKVGTSPFFRIRVRDREAVIASLEEILGEISSRLLDLLGDFLEQPETAGARRKKPDEEGAAPRRAGAAPQRPPLEKQAEGVLKKIAKARAMLRPQNPREALASIDLDIMRNQLRDAIERYLKPAPPRGKRGETAAARRRDLAARREEATEAFERLATMGEDLQRHVRVDQVGRMTDSMLQRQRALERALEHMRKTGGASPEAMRRVERELARLQRELDRLMRQMARLARRMPAEFMNQRGMRDLPMRNMMQAIDKIRQQIRQGDLRAALESLRRLMSQLRRMRAGLRGIRRQQMMAQRGGNPIRRRQNELAAIVEEQQAILGETVSVLDGVVDRLKKGWPKGLGALADRVRRGLEDERALAKGLAAPDCAPKEKEEKARAPAPRGPSPQEAREEALRARRGAIEDMASTLERGEWGMFYHRLPEWRSALGEPGCAEAEERNRQERDRRKARWGAVGQGLEGLLEKAEGKSPSSETASLQGLRFRQEALGRRLGEFEEQIRRLMQIFPFIDPNVLRRIVLAREAMGRAAGWLGRKSSSRAVPPEEEAIRHLAQGQNAMQQAMRQMARRGSLGLGIPRGFGIYRSGPLPGWWARNPNLPGQEGFRQSGREEDGRLGTQFGEVLIPDRDQYRVPPEFREEVMEALKDGMPGTLRGEIENYFDRLTK